MNVFLGTDHHGFMLKEQLKQWLHQRGDTVVDCGNEVLDPVDDFPGFAKKVAEQVIEAADPQSLGIVMCGSGVGVDITANKIKGIRCGLGFLPQQVEFARKDDNINVLALATDYISFEEAKALVEAFLNTPFGGQERALRRLREISEIEVA